MDGTRSQAFARKRRGTVQYVTNGYVRKSVEKVCAVAKIKLGDRPAVHCLRHTWNNLVRQHASELVRQALIGHADEANNERYSKVGEDEKRTAVHAVVKVVKGGA
ncbi:hypothetical protein [Sandaracinus amylolyticus]|uniref:hypothetical protein n=1 Tax=Sandaracinus amylolyticus TaxID=927083 RepID=UPI001F3FA95C|nr:hypothetical protein [Sandaracinus amylolyticus]UJR81519.1 Hypothetical protein I5071_35790 [Sandaracinus amylolyticus]